jgi:hypothetical protein
MIDWSTAPEWAIGAAMDGDEKWFWYSEKPEHVEEDYGFWGVDGLFEIIYQDIPKALDWRESWTPKPKPEPMTTKSTIEHLTLGGQAPAIMPTVKLSVDDGGPAFPTLNGLKYNDGMSLRDYFAGQALAGIWASPHTTGSTDDIAKLAYKSADAMLEARTLKPE